MTEGLGASQDAYGNHTSPAELVAMCAVFFSDVHFNTSCIDAHPEMQKSCPLHLFFT